MKRKRHVRVKPEAATSVEVIWLDVDGGKHIQVFPFSGVWYEVTPILSELFTSPEFRTLCAVDFHYDGV